MIDRYLYRLMRSSFRRTMAGEHWTWALLAASLFVLRRARRPQPHEVLAMRRGDRLLITSGEPVERRR